jgi:hypothetical protein
MVVITEADTIIDMSLHNQINVRHEYFNVNGIGWVFGYSDRLDSPSNTHLITRLETLTYK